MSAQGDRVELWLVDLKRCAAALEDLERAIPRLSADETAPLQDANSERAPSQRRAAHIALRLAVERAAGAHVRGQELARGLTGKPYLADGSAEFSLSHTDGYALIAVSTSCPVGVDVEKARPLKMEKRHCERIIAAGAGLADKPLAGRPLERAFLQAWCRLEAYTKARGQSLARALADVGLKGRGRVPLTLDEIEARARRLVRAAGLKVGDVQMPCGLYGAIAAGRHAVIPRPVAFPAERAGLERLAHHGETS
jgi:4'-phosphopantetheinyl transferase